jgi:hypothetical protein
MPVLWKTASVWMLLFCMVPLSGSLQADSDFWGAFEGGQLSPAAQDRIFEGKVYGLLEQQAGAVAKYIEVTRLGNIIVITGEVTDSAHATVIDGLVLEAAGIKRETGAGEKVVPERDRECGGRIVTGNAKRRMIVSGKKDCSALRSDEPGQAKGKVYNHIAVAVSDPAMKVAAANLLLAKAVLELVDAGYTQVLDRAAMRLVVQDGVFYILGSLGDVEHTRIKAVLMALPRVSGVTFYTE